MERWRVVAVLSGYRRRYLHAYRGLGSIVGKTILPTKSGVGIVEENVAVSFKKHHLELNCVRGILRTAVCNITPFQHEFPVGRSANHVPEHVVITTAAE